jgi:hypothetical protein
MCVFGNLKHWNFKEVRKLCKSLKSGRGGTGCMGSFVKDEVHGLGGNQLSDQQISDFQVWRDLHKKTKEFPNPMMIWADYGGENGYWGCDEVCAQFTELLDLYEFLQNPSSTKRSSSMWTTHRPTLRSISMRFAPETLT